MSDKKHNHLALILTISASLITLVVATWLLFNRQYVIDQISAWSYHEPADVKTIQDRIDLTDKGLLYFQATQPVVASSDDFNKDCPRQETGSPILGCYATGRIYIYNITNSQLDGIEEVTAAHEMLHAIWDRMSASEKKNLGTMLRNQYAKIQDPDLKTRMDYYARTEPGEFENELHSIIGTEIASLNPELETYYAQYFKDRTKVTDLHAKYSAVFAALTTESDTLYTELVTLGKDIETRSNQYNVDVAALKTDITSFNERADSGSFSSLSDFNRERATLVSRSSQLESDRISINADIATYQTKYNRYQELSDQIKILNKSIDSIQDLNPAPSL
ncbi:MAG: hypothetical protein JWM52_58 [Candidatus Saccharibacteria bacterium]|nr:hypothetical protein [Candidatus Saccharibacteria bacterium]